MKKQTQLIKHLLADFISANIAWFLFNIFRYYEVAQNLGFGYLYSFLTYRTVVFGQLFIPVFWIILHYYSGYYNKPLEKSRLSEFFTTLFVAFTGSLVLFFVILLNDLPESFHIYYEQFFYLFLISFFCMYIPRLVITQIATRKIHQRKWLLKAVILGTGKAALKTRQLLEKPSKSLGYDVIGFIDTETTDLPKNKKIKGVIGDLNDLKNIIKEYGIDELIVAMDTEDNQQLLSLLYSLYPYKLPIKMPVTSTKILTNKISINTISAIPLTDLTNNNFSEFEKNIKNTLDKIISFFVLLLCSPVYLYLIIKIKRDSPGPAIIKQERIGYRGEPFTIYKFRTMVQNAEKNGPQLSSEKDSRITPFGKFLRKYRIDELPQFWNVLKGDMSLVGPRPERRYFIDKIVKVAPYYYLLHNVKPGITSWGMVKYGYASNTEQMIERMQYDILYYENMSLLIDFKIIIHTVKTVLTGRGI